MLTEKWTRPTGARHLFLNANHTQRMQTHITTVTYQIHDLTDYLNWIYFFHAW